MLCLLWEIVIVNKGEININIKQLETFVSVSDTGSFKKSAIRMEITSQAVMKQINTLESILCVELFTRTNQGVTLTESGKAFYNDAKQIIKYTKDSMVRAKNAEKKSEKIIRIGISPLTPGKKLNELWCKIREICPDTTIKFVYFDGKIKSFNEVFEYLGKDVDIAVGCYDDAMLEEFKCEALKIQEEPVCCAVPIFSHLANKDSLCISDLYGESLMMLKRSGSKSTSNLRNDLVKNHSEINIIDFDFYTLDTLTKCVNDNNIILALNIWNNLHPLMKVLPVEWNHTLSYGLFYGSNPSNVVEEFLGIVTQALGKQ